MPVEHDDELRALNAFNAARRKAEQNHKAKQTKLNKLARRVRNVNDPVGRREAIRELVGRARAGEFESVGVPRQSVHIRIVESKVQVVIPDPPKKRRQTKKVAKGKRARAAKLARAKELREELALDELRAKPGQILGTSHVPYAPWYRERYLRMHPDEQALADRYAEQRKNWPAAARGSGTASLRGSWPAMYGRNPGAGMDDHRHTEAPWKGFNERSFVRELQR